MWAYFFFGGGGVGACVHVNTSMHKCWCGCVSVDVKK